MNKLDENGMPMPESLGRAERSMREAEDALRRGDPREASRSQRRALDNLQQGMGDMAEQMRQPRPGQRPGPRRDRGARAAQRGPRPARPLRRQLRRCGRHRHRQGAARARAPAQPRDPRRAAPPRRRAAAAEGRARLHRPAAQDLLARPPSRSARAPRFARTAATPSSHHPDIRQAAEAVGPVEAVADEELVAGLEADEVGFELGAPLARLVEQGADRDAARAALRAGASWRS